MQAVSLPSFRQQIVTREIVNACNSEREHVYTAATCAEDKMKVEAASSYLINPVAYY